MLRSILSVVAGYAIVAIITILSLLLIGAVAPGAFPDPRSASPGAPAVWVLGVLLAIGAAAMIIGGFTTARIGQRRPLAHAIVLGVILAVLGLLTLVTSTDQPVPAWYRVVGALIGLPAAAMGGWLAATRSAPQANQAAS